MTEKIFDVDHGILNQYPSCRWAVAFCELYLAKPPGDSPDPRSSFDILRSCSPPIPLKDALEVIQECIKDSNVAPHISQETRMRLMEDSATPEFLSYIRAVLGAL